MNNNIIAIRQMLKEAYLKEQDSEDGLYCKSSDGAVSVAFYYNNDWNDDKSWEEEPRCTVSIYSYVFGPNRMNDFDGINLEDASKKALNAVIEWLKPYKE